MFNEGAELIPVEPLRAAFERSGITKSELARRMGWIRTMPDNTRVSTTLGYHGRRYGAREHVRPDTARGIAEALNLDPVEVGL